MIDNGGEMIWKPKLKKDLAISFDDPFSPEVKVMMWKQCVDCGKLTCVDIGDLHPLCLECALKQEEGME